MSNKNRSWPEWYRLIQGRDILFIENEYKFKVIPAGLWKHLRGRAKELLDNRPTASSYEREHWQKIVDGIPPYGLKVEDKPMKGNRDEQD